MNVKSVLHPMGGMRLACPAEKLRHEQSPPTRLAVEKNVKRFKEQLKLIGLEYDWNREINTTDPEFYKWTQWIFLKLFDMGLAYQSFEPINWCPSCQTGLANEDLEGNACEMRNDRSTKAPDASVGVEKSLITPSACCKIWNCFPNGKRISKNRSGIGLGSLKEP